MIRTILTCDRCKKERVVDFDRVVLGRETVIGEEGFYTMENNELHLCGDCLGAMNKLKKEMEDKMVKFLRGEEDES